MPALQKAYFMVGILLLVSCGVKRQQFLRNPSSIAEPVELAENQYGGGVTVSGRGAFSVPTAEGLVQRLQNGLDGNVKGGSGNFAKSLAQVKKNLPQLTDPTKATGFDQVQLLVYGACSDLTTGTTPLMLSKYGVNPGLTPASNQTSLIAAGLQMLDRHTAGLASQSTATGKIKTALTTLTTQLAAGGNTPVVAFMSVCITANTVGATLLGF